MFILPEALKEVPNFLAIADVNMLLQLVLSAEVTIYILADQNRLDGSKAEHNSCSQKAVQHS